MSAKDRNALVQYRLEQAEEALQAARALLGAGLCRDSVNRSYYAMFYAVLAMLTTRSLGTSKHSGAISLFDREFVKSGLFPREFSRWLHAVFEKRLESDYAELVTVTVNEAQTILTQATKFVDAVRKQVPGTNTVPVDN